MTSFRVGHEFGASLAAALGALFVGVIAWFTVMNSTRGAVSHTTVIAAFATLVAAFLPLGLLARARPLAPLRISLGVAVFLSIFDAMGLPAPPRPESISSFVLLFLIVVLAVAVHLLAAPKPRIAFALLVGIGIVGVYLAYAVDWYTTSTRYAAIAKVSSWPIAVIGAACICACWHGRALLRWPHRWFRVTATP